MNNSQDNENDELKIEEINENTEEINDNNINIEEINDNNINKSLIIIVV